MRRKRFLVVLACPAVLIVVGLVVWSFLPPKPLYRVTFLPTTGVAETRVGVINDSGQVAAAVRMVDGTERVVLWDKSDRTEDLASLPRGSSATTMVINNAGQVACTIFDPNHTRSSFWDTDGRHYALDMPGVDYVRVGALNNRGQVVGYCAPTGGPRHAFLWEKSAGMQDLGTFGGTESVACDLNDSGQIVGYFAIGRLDWRAFIYEPNVGMRELGFKKSGWDGKCFINNRGFVVGQFRSAQSGLGVSTWTDPAGPQPLPWKGDDFLMVSGLNDADGYLVNVRHEGIRVWRRTFGERSESHLWEAGRHVRLLTGSLCCGEKLRCRDIEAVCGWDINRDGTILATLKTRRSSAWRAALLEPIQ